MTPEISKECPDCDLLPCKVHEDISLSNGQDPFSHKFAFAKMIYLGKVVVHYDMSEDCLTKASNERCRNQNMRRHAQLRLVNRDIRNFSLTADTS
jgi:hypothetical protein